MFFNTKPQLSKDVSKNIIFSNFLRKTCQSACTLAETMWKLFSPSFTKNKQSEAWQGHFFFAKNKFQQTQTHTPLQNQEIFGKHTKVAKKFNFWTANEDARNHWFGLTSQRLSFEVPKSAFFGHHQISKKTTKLWDFRRILNQNKTSWTSYVTSETLF